MFQSRTSVCAALDFEVLVEGGDVVVDAERVEEVLGLNVTLRL